MKKVLFLITAMSPIIISAASLAPVKGNNELKTSYFNDSVGPEDFAYNIIEGLLKTKTTDGESLHTGSNVDVALPLLFKTFESIRSEAIAQASALPEPEIAEAVAKDITNIKDSDMKAKHPDDILLPGDHPINVTLAIGTSTYDLAMDLINVAS